MLILRPMREMVDTALREMSPVFEELYAETGRPSIPPERLLRALLVQVLFSVRSERQLMEQLEYNLLFRWFVGLGMDDPVWVPTTFTKNRHGLVVDARLAQADGYAERTAALEMLGGLSGFFGWMKTLGGIRKTRYRGQARVDWTFTFTAAAYDLVRMRNPRAA